MTHQLMLAHLCHNVPVSDHLYPAQGTVREMSKNSGTSFHDVHMLVKHLQEPVALSQPL
jgi:hypothetical protein